MVVAVVVFLFVTGGIVGLYGLAMWMPGALERRRLGQRLQEIGPEPLSSEDNAGIVVETKKSALPIVDQLVASTGAAGPLAKLIAQADSNVTPGGVVMISIALAVCAGIAAFVFVRHPLAALAAAAIAAMIPVARLHRQRSSRLAKFEEQFPEALDLVSRALRAGHAFQTSMSMVASELQSPVGPEFKKTFDQQNFGLPLKEAMNNLAERVPLLDVQFFVTAVAIQRDTGGNLAEILESLAHVVRERFKIRRQVRVHTAHGRFTGYVLLALPAFLALALSQIAPDQMKLLFYEPMGRIMVTGAVVLQTIGYFWIRKVIQIEV